jgi:RNA polymerase sigma factor (sigma-70 family)
MNNPLLHRYVTERSEAAFTELVQQYIDVVYSAALRQVNNDPIAAEDVTQAVFTDLARKAPRLVRHTSLTGWLYTSTRYLSTKVRRTEHRRVVREQEAYAMNQLLHSTAPDPAWEELRPVLDEAMHELSPADREAVLLRYFERRPIAEIGTWLGLTEDTARKRVARAIDKLRGNLAKRGITSTVGALSVVLSERTVSAAPAGMAGRLSHAAISTLGSGGGTLATFWKLLIAGGVAATVMVVAILPKFSRQTSHVAVSAPIVPAIQTAAVSARSDAVTNSAVSETPPVENTGDKLILHIVTADTGQPIPSVTVEYWWGQGDNVNDSKTLTASRFGICEVPVKRTPTTQVVLVTERDGFADTRLRWYAAREQTIPQEYTLRLARAVSIAGTVVDPDGNPVAGAKVGFGNWPDPSKDAAIETSDFEWPFWIAVTSDTQGHWQITRMAPEVIRSMSGAAQKPLYVRSAYENNPENQSKLLAGTYEFRLGRAAEVSGCVVNTNGEPVPNAKVTIGQMSDVNSRETNSDAHGGFHLAGCMPGQTLLTAEANGYAATTMPVDLKTNAGPIRITLAVGKVLRLHVVNREGNPISKAMVWLNPFSPDGANSAPVQVDFERSTDAKGNLKWSNAPNRELTFDISAAGYMRVSRVTIMPNEGERVITLPPALTISGTVRDAATGELIPSFKVIAGWQETNQPSGVVHNRWSGIDRFWLSFAGGTFHHIYDEPLRVGDSSYVFKIEAEGYAPFITRPVGLDEGDVQLDAQLRAAASTVVTVTNPDGLPAANVDVGFLSPGARLYLVPGGISRSLVHSEASVIMTDSQGHFALKPDDSVTGVVAANADGYAEATVAALASDPVIVLQPWGKLEGTVLLQKGPTTNCTLALQFGAVRRDGVSAEFGADEAQTDTAGHFLFAQVPPGTHRLVQRDQVSGPNGGGVASRLLTNVFIQSGEKTSVTVNGLYTARPRSAAHASMP